MASHQLQKLNTKQWHCSVCLGNWRSRSSTECPGLPRYDWSNKPANLQSWDDLEKQNLKPKGKATACIYLKKSKAWLALYDANDVEKGDIPDLPPIYTWDNRPPELKTPSQLRHRNLKQGLAKALGCIWHHKDGWIYLYNPQDCEIDDPTLPPFVERGTHPELKAKKQLEELNLKTENAAPRGFYRYYDKGGNAHNVLLYHPDDCEWSAKDQYICKTTLKKTYLLSPGWIKRLGEPDFTRVNPHHHKFSGMQLYSKQRIEAFLADHAEEYALWVDERERYIAIFEANQEAITEGKKRHLEQQRDAKQLLNDQTKRCLRCASGCATPKGFLCAIYPKGLEVYQIPCPDWQERN